MSRYITLRHVQRIEIYPIYCYVIQWHYDAAEKCLVFCARRTVHAIFVKFSRIVHKFVNLITSHASASDPSFISQGMHPHDEQEITERWAFIKCDSASSFAFYDKHETHALRRARLGEIRAYEDQLTPFWPLNSHALRWNDTQTSRRSLTAYIFCTRCRSKKWLLLSFFVRLAG